MPAAGHRSASRAATPNAVVDTNVWLDVFLFLDPGARRLAQALAGGELLALRSRATDAELRTVLDRQPLAGRWDEAARESSLKRWQALAREWDAGAIRPAPWQCRDPMDQKFLDLASASGARWLLTKDRALLDLAAKARAAGLRIVTAREFERLQAAD
jgi:putative PIN family toxin of toxin-antitoxin system